MYSRADLALYDPSGRLTAIAEIKNKLGTSGDWAAKTRRNLLAHSGFSSADFFLLVTPDHLYVWKESGDDLGEKPPNYVADAESIFAPYFKRVGLTPQQKSGYAFELIVAEWLGDVKRSAKGEKDAVGDESWLVSSGFYNAVKDGRIEYEAVA